MYIMNAAEKNIISADIGGTHSRFAHFSTDREGNLSLEDIHWLRTADYRSFGEVIEDVRGGGRVIEPGKADIVVLAVAGPVEEGTKSSPPFISWGIDISSAEKEFGFRKSVLINDFVAQAYACRSAVGRQAEQILEGSPVKGSIVAVVGAGTGLGKALSIPDGRGGYTALPSEGGHSNFPFVTGHECDYQQFLMKERGESYITGNIVVSGRGLSYLHRFLTGEALEPDEISKRFDQHPETVGWMARFYGRICRNYALETLALGGLFIAGGVAARSPELVRSKDFEIEFRTSPTLAHLLRKIPVFLIRDENSGLWGGAFLGLQELGRDDS